MNTQFFTDVQIFLSQINLETLWNTTLSSGLTVVLSLLSFILVVFPIVIIHEFGHFLVGKWLGAEPSEFSIGFGKELCHFNWLGARFKVCAIPLGGYVKFKRNQFEAEFGEGDSAGRPKLVAWKWIPIALAGPLANFILTFAIFFGFFTYGLNLVSIGEITDSKNPAISKGNNIFIVADSPMSGLISEQFFGSRDHRIFYSGSTGIIPYPNPEKYASEVKVEQMKGFGVVQNFNKSFELSGRIMLMFVSGTVDALTKLVSEKEGYKQVMGPMGMANEAQKARERSVLDMLLLMAAISFAVGFFNLLPLTFLDGGRIVLAAGEMVFRKSISMVTLQTLNLMSLALVFGLFLTGMYSDVTRLFFKK